MRPVRIVVESSALDLLTRIIDRHELIDVQAFISQSSVERFYARFSVGFPGCVKSSFTPRRYAHSSSAFDVNSVP